MNMSFYAAGVGAGAHQNKMDIVSNNLVNGSTEGYKTKNEAFSDLIYSNINQADEEETDIKRGSGARIDKTNIVFMKGAFEVTGEPHDYAIEQDGFFAVENPITEERFYTTDGNFSVHYMENGDMYLGDHNGYQVIGKDDEPIFVGMYGDDAEPGIFMFDRKDRLQSEHEGYLTSIDEEVPTLTEYTAISGVIELSNVNTADQMTKVIEAQRAFQYNLRMLQTSDELEQTFNSFR